MASHFFATCDRKPCVGPCIVHDPPKWSMSYAITMIDGGGCPVPSSVTGMPCVLHEGHPCDSPTRFHRYAPKSSSAPKTSAEPAK